jgi:DNA-binding CsgD family transcriptional regulator/tetratricopeptide (TPR) repeat protein
MPGPVSSPVFVGRREELSVLDTALSSARQGQGAVVLVAGEAGIGKSRLIAELSASARVSGATVLTGECLELAEGELPYAPIVGALRSFLREHRGEDAEELFGGTRDELARLLPELAPDQRQSGEASDSMGAQARLFEQLLATLSALARPGPVLLVIEDLHWADRSTRDFVSFLVRNARRESLALIASYRSDELHMRHPLRPFVLELERNGGARRIDLRPFAREELAEQLESILGEAPDPDLLARLLQRSDGNPFFAEELLAASSPTDAVLPQSLRDALLLRVEELPDAAQVLLRIAAVAGRTIEHGLLEAVARLPESELEEGLRAAVAGYVLVHRSGSMDYSFRHALLREAVYEDLLPGERRRLHIDLARALAAHPELGSAKATTAAELAHHWHAARELREALPASVRAGIEAEAVRAVAEAALHYERALEIWDAVGDDNDTEPALSRVEVTTRAADAENLAGESERAVALARGALELVDETTEPVTAALIHERLGRYLWTAGRGEDALLSCRRAVELMPAEPPSRERALVLAAEAQVLMLCARFAESVVRCEQAVEIAREVGAQAVEAHALNTIAVGLDVRGEADEAVATTARAREIAKGLGLVEEIGRSYVNGSDALDQAGRVEESIALAREGIVTARELGIDRSYGDFLRAEIVGRLLRTGRWDEAHELLEELLDRALMGVGEASCRQLLGQLLADRGELEEAADQVARGAELVTRSGGSMWLGPLVIARATIELWAGRPEAAAQAVRECLEQVEGFEFPFSTARLYELGARAGAEIVEASRRDEATVARESELGEGLLRRLDGLLAEPTGKPPPLALAARAACAAEVSRISGDGGSAGLWAETQRLWEQAGDPYLAAYARWRHAETLLTDGGERREVERLAREAHAVAESLGAGPLRDELEALARRARLDLGGESDTARGASAPSAALERLDLTPRELEVLGLLAGGSTNRDIAERLFISEKTASVHVSHILAKLGSRNRLEAAGVAHRLGVVPPEQ